MNRQHFGLLVATVGLVLVACAKERALDAKTATTAAPTEPVAYADSRISRVAALIGKTKQDVVQTLGTPTDPGYDGRSFGDQKGDWKAVIAFYDPEREHSLFGSQARGAAATATSLLMRFEWKPDLGVVLKSLDAPPRPAYIRLSRSRIAWMLQNVPNQHVYDVAFGG